MARATVSAPTPSAAPRAPHAARPTVARDGVGATSAAAVSDERHGSLTPPRRADVHFHAPPVGQHAEMAAFAGPVRAAMVHVATPVLPTSEADEARERNARHFAAVARVAGMLETDEAADDAVDALMRTRRPTRSRPLPVAVDRVADLLEVNAPTLGALPVADRARALRALARGIGEIGREIADPDDVAALVGAIDSLASLADAKGAR